ncbi:MAG: AbrB/MazE/SpoVT family DNA-binding domain-containing protein [Eubacteriales bacterium]|nr:AbrB/MazE/SpoVT family DNA-binding domain-containing protein [Eubacteriales bacterium]
MRSTGIVRKVDELGRIVLPMELRKNLGINIKDALEIFISNDKIILKKYNPSDIFTGDMTDLIEYKGKKVSRKSIIEMAKIAGFEISNLQNYISESNIKDEFELEIDEE